MRKKKTKKKKSKNYYLLILLIISLAFFSYKFSHQKAQDPENLVLSSSSHSFQSTNNGSREIKKVAFTFDADMTPSMMQNLKNGTTKSLYNKKVIDILIKEKIKATIFVTGIWVRAYPNETKEISDNPLFEIENHSYSHFAFTPDCYKLSYISNNKDSEEIENAQKLIKETTGITPKYFRFPGGCSDQEDVKIVKKNNLKIIGWDVASGDAFNSDTNQIIKNVELNVKNGSIVVFHLNGDIYAPKTNDALLKIIPYLKKQGYEFVKISELLAKSKYSFLTEPK